MSIAAIGSVQVTTSRSPGASRPRALRVFKAGRGHFNPERSRTVSVMARLDKWGSTHNTARPLLATWDRRETVSSFAALTPVEAVLARLKTTCGPSPSEEIPLAAASGRILAADVVARDPVPCRPTALIDGFAVTASDLVGVS